MHLVFMKSCHKTGSTTEKTNLLMSFKENIYREDIMKYAYNL
jgi:hypothetical protein